MSNELLDRAKESSRKIVGYYLSVIVVSFALLPVIIASMRLFYWGLDSPDWAWALAIVFAAVSLLTLLVLWFVSARRLSLWRADIRAYEDSRDADA